MSPRALLVEVRLPGGRYHGVGDWPPPPFRLFQALIAGAYGGRWQAEPPAEAEKDAAFGWLERLPPPWTVAPPKSKGQGVTYYVPNNDLDSVGGDPRRVEKIRTAKFVRPIVFDEQASFLYAWRFEEGEEHAAIICRLAERLHTLGRGADAAFAHAEVLEWAVGENRLDEAGRISRPCGPGGADDPTCPTSGSLASLKRRFAAATQRFETKRAGRNTVTLFRQPPKAACFTISAVRKIRIGFAPFRRSKSSGSPKLSVT